MNEPESAAELYYALTGIKCEPEEVEMLTIETVISGKLKNDLAFIVRGKVMIISEHTSSICQNMPIRILIYTGRLYEKYIKIKGESELLYGSKLYKIPTPEFIVFYNGKPERQEKEVLKLSFAFEGEKNDMMGFIELEVPVYNINKGMNSEILSKSENLKQYAMFVDTWREYQENYKNPNRAAKDAIQYCIDNNILAKFLRKHGGDIVSVLMTEYDEEIAKKVWREEAFEEGIEKGIKKGMLITAKNALKKGVTTGFIKDITGFNETAIKKLQEEIYKE